MILQLVLATLLALATSEKILMQGLPFGTSHHMLLSKIGRELVARGHEVVPKLDFHHVAKPHSHSQVHFVRTTVDSDRVNTTGLKVHTVALPTSREHYANHVLELADQDPLQGTASLFLRLPSHFLDCQSFQLSPTHLLP